MASTDGSLRQRLALRSASAQLPTHSAWLQAGTPLGQSLLGGCAAKWITTQCWLTWPAHEIAPGSRYGFSASCRLASSQGLVTLSQTFVRHRHDGNCLGGSRMSNGTASALNSERGLASIPTAQGGLSRLAIARLKKRRRAGGASS
jgi:hypothetical protein